MVLKGQRHRCSIWFNQSCCHKQCESCALVNTIQIILVRLFKIKLFSANLREWIKVSWFPELRITSAPTRIAVAQVTSGSYARSLSLDLSTILRHRGCKMWATIFWSNLTTRYKLEAQGKDKEEEYQNRSRIAWRDKSFLHVEQRLFS